MEDKLKQEVEAAVKKIFASKKDAEVRKRTEDALSESASTIETLTSELKTEKEKSSDLDSKLTTASETISTLEASKEDADKLISEVADTHTKEVDDLKKDLDTKVAELADIKKDALAATRMDDLSTAGVVRDDKEGQTAKVREMSDEEFASYIDELKSVRASIMAELKKAADTKVTDDKVVDDKVVATDETDTDKDEDSEGVVTPPANIDPGQSVSAAMNMEIYPSDDLVAQYADMGKAMAEAMTKDK